MAYEDARKPKNSLDHLAERVLLSESLQADKEQESRDEEELKARYTRLYNRIYPLLHDGRLDYHLIADKTGFKERRLRETLLFRLTTGEVLQLFGRKDGYCYICSHRISPLATKEPMCLECLQRIDTVIQENKLSQLSEPSSPERPDLRWDEDAAEADAGDLPVGDPSAWVPRSQFEAAITELKAYRTAYGPLVQYAAPSYPEHPLPETQESPLENHSADSGWTNNVLPLPLMPHAAMGEPVPVADPASSPESAALSSGEAILEMLRMNDRDVPLAALSLSDIPGLTGNEPIRHFGFLRLKTKDGCR